MKIEDAIKRYESWAEDDRIDVLIRKEHRQIADWLKKLNADRPQKVVAQVTFDEEKLREIVKEAVERFKEEYEITDRPQGEWIPCSERLPEDIRPVLVTWKNNDPASYYQYIVGKHFIGTAHYHRGKWYWYSSVTEDLLAEYGKCETEEFDEAIEAVAWMPLPKPWKGAGDE